MPYVRRSTISIDSFTPSDDIIIANDPYKSIPPGGIWYMIKEIILLSTIGSTSKFRFYFEGAASGGGDSRARIYRNGVPIGSDTGGIPGGGGYTAYTEDINATNFSIGDRIQLYGKADNGGAYLKHFRIMGVGSKWGITVV